MSTLKPVLILISALSIINTPFVYSEVFKWVDDTGKVSFGDRPPLGVNAKKIEIKVASGKETRPIQNLKGDKEIHEAISSSQQKPTNKPATQTKKQKIYPRRSAPSSTKKY